MKLKASYSDQTRMGISLPLLMENLRRFWAIPVLAFLAYFFSAAFPILMSYSQLNQLSDYIRSSLSNQQPFYMAVHLMIPVIASVSVFRYLQGSSSVAVFHAMPFSRARLLHTNAVSGLILVLLPILANGLILLLIARPALINAQSTILAERIDVFTRAAVLGWVWQSIVIVLFIYAISLFAGLVTGNPLMHFLSAIGFNFLVPGLYAIFTYYFTTYLFGFISGEAWSKQLTSFSPYLKIFEGPLSWQITLVYLLVVAALYGITLFLYHRRRLERAGDPYVFQSMNLFMTYLIGFLGMSFLGVYFTVFGKAWYYQYAGYLAGILLFFVIGQMIVQKTPRVFHLYTLKHLGIYTLLAVIFIAGLEWDLTGFESRIPAVDQIQRAKITTYFNYSMETNQDFKGYEDPENMQAIRAFHQEVLDQKSVLEANAKHMDYSVKMVSVPITYRLKSGGIIDRNYVVPFAMVKDSQALKQIHESKEYKKNQIIRQFAQKDFRYFRLYSTTGLPFSVELTSQQQKAGFLEALIKDLDQQSFESMVSLRFPYATADLWYSTKDQAGRLQENVINLPIRSDFTNTLAWIRNAGYEDDLTLKQEELRYITVTKTSNDMSYQPGSVVPETIDKEMSMGYDPVNLSKVPVQTKNLMVITDPASMEKIMSKVDMESLDYRNQYMVTIVHQRGKEYGIQSGYLNDPDLPSQVKEYFQ